MKSITTCPSCQTQFLVTDEQLSQYNGKVRCGHCLNVFNAIDYIAVQPVENQQVEITTELIVAKDTDAPKEQSDTVQESFIDPNNGIQNIETPSSQNAIENLASTANIEKVAVDSEAIYSQTETILMDSASEAEINNGNFVADTSQSDITSSEINSADVLKELFAQAKLPLEETLDPKLEQDVSTSFENTPIQSEFSPEEYQEEVSKINTFDYKPEYQYFLDEKKINLASVIYFRWAVFIVGIITRRLFLQAYDCDVLS